ncbi:hypothetical protein [Methylomarinovum caldicuralii]|uniref:hypothetical protein n=1 Tax=Methylomarinovum caldicuralii TaxID=438856 RepID=UPI0029550E1C|nr:hypothetical protein [Methylomarinovum caldicuralii]
MALTALTVAGMVGYGAWMRLQRAEDQLRRQQHMLESLEDTLEERTEALAIVESSGARFHRVWPRSGGSSSRLDWIATVGALAPELQVPVLKYTLGPRTSIEEQEDIRLWRVDIDLQLGLVHEGALLAFWQALESSNLGIFDLRACRIARRSEPPAPQAVNLEAACRLAWYGFSQDEVSENDRDDDGLVDAADGP